MLSTYYVAKVVKNKTWFVSGCVRNLGHVALERSLCPKEDLFEFFVAPLWEKEFEALMQDLIKKSVVVSCEKVKNRFEG